jgi:crotonobetaine/carnitine-CoA ligase
VSTSVYEPTVLDVLRKNCEVRPASRAVGDSKITLSYKELWTAGCRSAGGLAALGIRRQDVVLAMLDNSADYAVTVVGASFLGAVLVPTNTAYKGNILHHIVHDSTATSAVVESHLLQRVVEAAEGRLHTIIVRGSIGHCDIPDGVRIVSLEDVLASEPADPVETHPWDVLCIGYTSGTTGPSKGAFITAAHGCQNLAGVHDIQGPHTPDDVVLVVCPIFHATGLFGGLVAAWQVGAYAHIAEKFSVSTFWDEADAIGATSTVFVGTMAQFLMRQPPRAVDSQRTMQKVFMVPLVPDADVFMERFGVTVSTAFGNTESGSIILYADEEGMRRRSLGKPRRGFDVRLVDEHDMEVGEEEVGEAVVRSDRPWLIAYGYVGNPDATASAWRNGWFHTGDALRRDRDGYYYFVDRLKDAIRRRGENISSVELEREVLAHPEVAECAAVGIASRDLEEEVKIVAVRTEDSSLTEEQLIQFLIPRIAYYMIPRFVVFADELPKTETAKVKKNLLREQGTAGCWDREAAGVVVSR